jgi:hypothetical protein
MEKYSSSDQVQDSVVNMNASFLRDTKGVTIFDSCILLVAKVIYLTLRILLRVSLGRKRRDRFYLKRKIGFNSFFYNLMRILGLSNHRLLKIIVRKYNYKFLCRINNEDYTFMTGHEDKILRRFSCKKEDIVLDVGAHIGHYTIISSERFDNYKPIVEFLNSYGVEIEFETGNEEGDWKHIIARKSH